MCGPWPHGGGNPEPRGAPETPRARSSTRLAFRSLVMSPLKQRRPAATRERRGGAPAASRTGTAAQGTAQAEAQTGMFWRVPGTARALGRTPEGEEAVDTRRAGEPLDGPRGPRSSSGLEGLAVGGHLPTTLPWSRGSGRHVSVPTRTASTECRGHGPLPDLRSPGQGPGPSGPPTHIQSPARFQSLVRVTSVTPPLPLTTREAHKLSTVSWLQRPQPGRLRLRRRTQPRTGAASSLPFSQRDRKSVV